MCGFLGEVTFKNELMKSDDFISLLSLSHNRGPDNTSIEQLGNVLRFGFNRLSILDQSSNALQPMWSPSRRYLVVYNGEIYNHMYLRNKLSGGGAEIKSHGDTATVVSCIDAWGISKSINHFDGMFAIAIWDNLEQVLTLTRDFAGIKPLFYGWNQKTFVFASQYNQIVRHPDFKDENLNFNVLKLYLSQQFISPPFGLFKNTFSVNPGEIVTINSKGIIDKRIYWEFPRFNQKIENQNNPANNIEEQIKSSVKDQLMSDVPLGAFLSGGVDSSLISSYSKEMTKEAFKTFTVGSDSELHDESSAASAFAKFLKTEHHTIKMTADNSVKILEECVKSVGEPLGDFSILPTWGISQFAKSHITVALSGDGGDELFFGYERFRSIAKNYWLWSFPYYLRYLVRGIDKLIFNEKYVNECVLQETPGVAHLGLNSRFSNMMIHRLIPDLQLYNYPDGYENYDYYLPKSKEELLYNIRKAEFYGMLQKTLAKVDRASMAHGLEVRVPFLKKSLIENVIKQGVKVHEPLNGRKKLLYELFKKRYQGLKSGKIKKGFTVPLSRWIQTTYKKTFYETLLDKNFCDDFGIKIDQMENILQIHVSGQTDYKWPLFSLYSLAVWNK